MRYLIPTLFCAAALAGCESNSPAPEPTAPGDSALASRAVSGDWLERKTAQRELSRLSDPAQRHALARVLVADAAAAPGRKALARAVRTAFALAPDVTLHQAAAQVSEASIDLRRRLPFVQALAREVDVDLAPPEFSALAREALRTYSPDSEGWGIGLRLLGRYAPAEAWPLIRAHLDAPKAQRRAAVAALSEQRFPASERLLAELAHDHDRYVRRKALKALRQFPGERSAQVIAQVLTREGETSVCSRAVEAAEAMPGELAVALLAPRLRATDGCGVAHRFAIVASLRRVLRRDPGLTAATAALQQVMAAPIEPAEAALAAAALSDLPMAVRYAQEGTYEGLISLTSRALETPETRVAAIQALGMVGGEPAQQRLLSLLGRVQEDAPILLEVVRALDGAGRVPAERRFLFEPYLADGEDPALRTAVLARLAQPPPAIEPPAAEVKDEGEHAHPAPPVTGPRGASPLEDRP